MGVIPNVSNVVAVCYQTPTFLELSLTVGKRAKLRGLHSDPWPEVPNFCRTRSVPSYILLNAWMACYIDIKRTHTLVPVLCIHFVFTLIQLHIHYTACRINVWQWWAMCWKLPPRTLFLCICARMSAFCYTKAVCKLPSPVARVRSKGRVHKVLC